MLFGFPGHHAFTHRPTFRRLKAECSREELAQRLADPAVKAAILSEDDLPPDPNVLFDDMFALVQYSLGRLYALGDPPDYEPTPDRAVAAIAGERGEDPLSTLYDLMLESDAHGHADAAVLQLLLRQPRRDPGDADASGRRVGLSDGGAHCGMICDASYPDVPADALGARSPPRREAAAGVRDPQAVSRHRTAVRAHRPRCRSRSERRPTSTSSTWTR